MNEWRSQPLISIILVNWNGANDLPRCLDSIFRQTYRSIEVIVVDNGSTDDSLDLLRKYPDLILLRNETNRGFSMANNQAIARAGGDWIFLLNVDAWMAPDCLQRLMERVLQEETIGSAAPKVYRGQGRTLDSTGILLQRERFSPADRGENQVDSGQFDGPDQEDIFGPSAAAALYRREALGESAQGREVFDEDFFAYYEDVDLAWRLRLLGWRSVYVPSAVCWHERKGPSGKPDWMRRRAYSNRYFCYLKNELLPIVPSYFLSAFFRETGRILKVIVKQPSMVGSFCRLAVKIPRMLQKRRWIQSRRKATLREMADIS